MSYMATTFQRARSEEQRAIRSQAILDTAAAMLEEMPVAAISLNELSRRVDLAKSNVLRYFDSREAILLSLMEGRSQEWIEHLQAQAPRAVRKRSSAQRRAEQLAALIATSLAQRPVLCDLMSSVASVLEHNVSAEVIAAHKRRSIDQAEAFTRIVSDALPELDDDEAWRYVVGAMLMVGTMWTHANPPEALIDACALDTRIESMRIDFATALEDQLTTIGVGLIARKG